MKQEKSFLRKGKDSPVVACVYPLCAERGADLVLRPTINPPPLICTTQVNTMIRTKCQNMLRMMIMILVLLSCVGGRGKTLNVNIHTTNIPQWEASTIYFFPVKFLTPFTTFYYFSSLVSLVFSLNMSPQRTWDRASKMTLVAFVRLLSTVCFQMPPQIACLNRSKVTLVAFV